MKQQETFDPFIVLLRKDAPRVFLDGETRYYKTNIVVQETTWRIFREQCHEEHISPSEMLHHLMRRYTGE